MLQRQKMGLKNWFPVRKTEVFKNMKSIEKTIDPTVETFQTIFTIF
jgi:hypothetical protein